MKIHGLLFDEAPSLYDRYRPGYPPAAVDALVELARLGPGARVLEVGAGTGQLTIPLLERGLAVTALEPGSRMAAHLARKVRGRPGAEVIVARFEDYQPEPRPFDAVIAATAFHWVDPAKRYTLAAAAVQSGGHIALVRTDHVLSEANEAYYRAVAPLYERLAPELGPPFMPPTAEAVKGARDEVASSGQFEVVAERQWAWDAAYTSSALVGLLRTYSNHRALPRRRRTTLLQAIRSFVDAQLGGVFVDRYVTSLTVGRRTDGVPKRA